MNTSQTGSSLHPAVRIQIPHKPFGSCTQIGTSTRCVVAFQSVLFENRSDQRLELDLKAIVPVSDNSDPVEVPLAGDAPVYLRKRGFSWGLTGEWHLNGPLHVPPRTRRVLHLSFYKEIQTRQFLGPEQAVLAVQDWVSGSDWAMVS